MGGDLLRQESRQPWRPLFSRTHPDQILPGRISEQIIVGIVRVIGISKGMPYKRPSAGALLAPNPATGSWVISQAYHSRPDKARRVPGIACYAWGGCGPSSPMMKKIQIWPGSGSAGQRSVPHRLGWRSGRIYEFIF